MEINVNNLNSKINADWSTVLSNIKGTEATEATSSVDGVSRGLTMSVAGDEEVVSVATAQPQLDAPEAADEYAIGTLCAKLGAGDMMNLSPAQVETVCKEVEAELNVYSEALSESSTSGVSFSAASSTVMFDIYALMALLVECGQKMRDAARDVRQAENEQVQTSILNQADAQRSAAMTGLICSVAVCAVQVGMQIYNLSTQGKSFAKQMEAQKASGVTEARAELKSAELQAKPQDAAANYNKVANATSESTRTAVEGTFNDSRVTKLAMMDKAAQPQQVQQEVANVQQQAQPQVNPQQPAQVQQPVVEQPANNPQQQVQQPVVEQPANNPQQQVQQPVVEQPANNPQQQVQQPVVEQPANNPQQQVQQPVVEQPANNPQQAQQQAVGQPVVEQPANNPQQVQQQAVGQPANNPQQPRVVNPEVVLPDLPLPGPQAGVPQLQPQAQVNQPGGEANGVAQQNAAPTSQLQQYIDTKTAELNSIKANGQGPNGTLTQEQQGQVTKLTAEINAAEKLKTMTSEECQTLYREQVKSELRDIRNNPNAKSDQIAYAEAYAANELAQVSTPQQIKADLVAAQAKFNQTTAVLQQDMNYLKGVHMETRSRAFGDMIAAIGNVGQSCVSSITEMMRAEATEMGAEQQEAQEMLDQAKDLFTQCQSVIDSVLQLMDSVLQAEVQSMRDAIQA